jgi:hypothetical protein
MDDQQILDTINSLQDVQERQDLRAQFQREGRTAAFRDALADALGRQAQKIKREEVVMRPAGWLAGKAGGLTGRLVLKLEQEADKLEEEQKG